MPRTTIRTPLSLLVLAACGGSETPAVEPAAAIEPAPVVEAPAEPAEPVESAEPAAPSYQNPVVTENCPDPGVLVHDGVYYAVCTTNDNSVADKFPIRRSSDLVEWELVGHMFPEGAVPKWAKADFWAPEIHAIGDQFVAYYTARNQKGMLSIGLATAPAIEGPWEDLGKPLIRDKRVGMIDAHQYQDVDGKRYLYWKADGNDFKPPQPTPIYVQPLADSGLKLTGKRKVILENQPESWEGDVIEGGSVVRRDDQYYFIYSGNAFNSDRYAVGVARGPSPVGPFEKMPDPILVSDEHFVGPGHGSVATIGDTDYYVYHAWRPGKVDPAWDQPLYPRVMLVDPITWEGGWPRIHDGTPSETSMPLPGEGADR